MAFDFKKEYKEFDMLKNKLQIVDIPEANYIAVRGTGNPNEEGGAYQKAISILYAVAYTLKMVKVFPVGHVYEVQGGSFILQITTD